MPTDKQQQNGDDNVTVLIYELYNELVDRRVELMKIRRNCDVPIPEKNKIIKDKLEVIEGLNKDFRDIVNMHSSMLVYQKKSGVAIKTESHELIKMIQDLKSNMGPIVADIPKQINNDKSI